MSTSKKSRSLLLDIRNISIEGYSDEAWHPIIKGVDLQINRGEVLGLIGESGAGKSTLGLAAMGFVRAGCRFTDGSISFEGKDLTKLSEKEKQKLWGTKFSYVAQSAAAAFNPAHTLLNQTIESSLSHNLETKETLQKNAVQLYREMQLPNPEEIGDRYPHQVSGGQLQRTMTAMAMTSKPDLIIFDEPTTALDVTTQVNVLATIRSIVKEHQTAAIYITHDLAVVAQMADRIQVLRYGETIEVAETNQMLKSPNQEYTKSLWAVRSIQKKEHKNEDTILKIENVDASYGSGPMVLKNININVPTGRTVAIVGESGSGKSTTARSITGLLPPTNGKVLFQGRKLPARLSERSKEDLRRIQMIYQSPDTSMNPRHTVRDIIGRPIKFYHGVVGNSYTEKVIELLKMIELDESFMDRLPEELSGGQKQRICIARALAAEPDLIICDEVTSALDQIVQEGILKLLLRLQQELKISYIFITHDIATVKAIADEVVVMHQGSVVEQGLKKDIFSPPHPDYTKLLLSSVPEMDPNWLTRILQK
jgi:peptide/nickel transport system ATP-binding protein